MATQIFPIFTPKVGEKDPISGAYFSDGLVQPPTSLRWIFVPLSAVSQKFIMKFRMDFETFFRSRLNPHLIGRNSSLLMSNHPKFEKKLLPQPKNNTPLPTKKSRKQKKTSSKFEKKNLLQPKHLSNTEKIHIPHTQREKHTPWVG